MKTVNDFVHHDCFVIKCNGETVGLQINIWGEDELSKEYGNCEVIDYRMENGEEIWGFGSLTVDTETLVLYI